MISSADFTVSLLGAVGASAPQPPQEGPQPRDAARQTESCRADLMTVSGQFSCPPPGSFMAVSGQFVVSAVKNSSCAWLVVMMVLGAAVSCMIGLMAVLPCV